jgi:hypothetical protein
MLHTIEAKNSKLQEVNNYFTYKIFAIIIYLYAQILELNPFFPLIVDTTVNLEKFYLHASNEKIFLAT